MLHREDRPGSEIIMHSNNDLPYCRAIMIELVSKHDNHPSLQSELTVEFEVPVNRITGERGERA